MSRFINLLIKRSPQQPDGTGRCSDCHQRSKGSFCDLPEGVLHDFETIIQPITYASGTLLFVEGQTSRGVFILCNGRVKLLNSSNNGKVLMRMAGPGEIIGFSATITETPYETTAEALELGKAQFIRKDVFFNFLQKHGEASLRATQILSRDYRNVYEQVKSLVLSDSVAEKFAFLLLRWCRENGQITEKGVQVELSLTHSEIAQMIGAARETVTRLFTELKNRQVIQLEGARLFVCDKEALESLVNP